MKKLIGALLIILSAVSLTYAQSNLQHVDVLIKRAWVFDETGQDSIKQDIGITGKKIVYIGNSTSDHVTGKKQIDANGLYLAPGFIDSHTHYGRWLNSDK